MMLIFFLAQNRKTKHKPTCEMDDRGTLHRASLEAGGPGEPMQLTGTVLLFVADNDEGQCPRLESALSLGI